MLAEVSFSSMQRRVSNMQTLHAVKIFALILKKILSRNVSIRAIEPAA